MEVLFENAALAELCSSQQRLATRYGVAAARSICARLHEIEAAASPSELERLPHLAVREVASSPATVSLVVMAGHRLVLRATDRAVRVGSDEWAAAASVTAVSMIEESAP